MTAPLGDDESDLVINLPPALARMGNDESLLRDLAGFFLEDAPPLLKEIERGIPSKDFELITRSAHSLKGLSANFDALRAVAAAQSLETSSRQQNLDATREILPKLRTEIQQVIAALKSEVLS